MFMFLIQWMLRCLPLALLMICLSVYNLGSTDESSIVGSVSGRLSVARTASVRLAAQLTISYSAPMRIALDNIIIEFLIHIDAFHDHAHYKYLNLKIHFHVHK